MAEPRGEGYFVSAANGKAGIHLCMPYRAFPGAAFLLWACRIQLIYCFAISPSASMLLDLFAVLFPPLLVVVSCSYIALCICSLKHFNEGDHLDIPILQMGEIEVQDWESLVLGHPADPGQSRE